MNELQSTNMTRVIREQVIWATKIQIKTFEMQTYSITSFD